MVILLCNSVVDWLREIKTFCNGFKGSSAVCCENHCIFLLVCIEMLQDSGNRKLHSINIYGLKL
jgi:hypothetical protein